MFGFFCGGGSVGRQKEIEMSKKFSTVCRTVVFIL